MVDVGVNPSYDPEARDRRVRAQEQLNRAIDARRNEALHAIRDCRILSLSRTPDNMVMWAHYASHSQGICIGIDWVKANLLASSGSRGERPIKPVTLTVDYKDHPFQSRFERHEDPVDYSLGRKHIDWAYEREVRILRYAVDFERYAPGQGDRVGLLSLPAEAVTDIVLGTNPAKDVRDLLRAQLRHFAEAKVRQPDINADGYNPRLREVRDVEQLA